MRTTAGRDWQARIMGDTSSNGSGNYAPATWMAISPDTSAPTAADVALSNEITSGSLARAQAVFAHTTGSSSYTLTRAITADQSVTIGKIGIFTASHPGGTLCFAALVNGSTGQAIQTGDQIVITHSVQL